MRYPKYKTYELLYAKYINQENLCEMMDLAGKDYAGKNFLDICCGSGRATQEAFKRNSPFCCTIDKEHRMVPHDMGNSQGIHQHFTETVEEGLNIIINNPYVSRKDISFEIAFCRQGINYWLTEETGKLLFEIMREGGVFIFNTFNTKPSFKLMIKEYKIETVNFCEISYMGEKDTVHHIQIREGFAPHITEFQWMSREYFQNCLAKYFKIDIITKGKTDIYKCIRK